MADLNARLEIWRWRFVGECTHISTPVVLLLICVLPICHSPDGITRLKVLVFENDTIDLNPFVKDERSTYGSTVGLFKRKIMNLPK